MNGVKRLDLMVCPKCFADISDLSAFCSECGSRIKEDTADSLYTEGSDREVYPEIARANLLRMRGQWEEAIQICINVLRRYPSNETAHALLGDIYSDQGQFEEAIHWYEMLVELAPTNVTFRAKLDQLQAIKRMKGAEQKPALPLMDMPEVEKRGWSPSQSVWVYTLLGILALGTLVSAFIAGMRMSSDNSSLNRTTPASMQVTSSALNDNAHQASGHDSPTETKREASEPPPATTSEQPFTVFFSTQEAILNRMLAESLPGKLVMGCYNPISGIWAVRGKVSGGALSQDRVFLEVYTIAEAFFKAMPDARLVTIILMVPSQQADTEELLFAADVPKIPIQTSLSPLTDSEIRSFFQNVRVWWNPRFRFE